MSAYTGKVVMNYLVGEKLGEGGFGAVYLAQHTELGRRVAIKFLHAEHARRPEVVERFLREARLVCAIGHPGIARVENSGRLDSGEPFYIMEYVEGESLAQWVKRRGPLAIDQLEAVFAPCVDALAAAHERGIIHRDLKPHNIMVQLDGERVVSVKLLDFGIAKLLDHADPNSVTGSILGTPNYMAPEQADDAKNVDVRADVYGLAATLYNAATGVKPFDRKPLSALLLAVQRDPPPAISPHVPDATPTLDRAVQRCMAKGREERPATIRLAWASIEAALSGADVTATTAPGDSTVTNNSAGEVTRTSARGRDQPSSSSPSPSPSRWPVLAILLVAVLAGGAVLAWRMTSGQDTPSVARGSGAPMHVDSGHAAAFDAAPSPPDAAPSPPDAAPSPPDAAPSPPDARVRKTRKRKRKPKKPRPAKAVPPPPPPNKPTIQCGKPSFARVYNASDVSRKAVLAALKRLRRCRADQALSQAEYEKIQAALIVRL